MAPTGPLHLAVALDGAGWHPAAWRDPGARPGGLFTPDYWTGLVRAAERGLIDLVTIEDTLGLQSSLPGRRDGRTDQVRGRFDAALVAARVAPHTSSIGLVPTITTTHTEPFHVSTTLATLDHVSEGRAGWRVKVSPGADEAAHFGRRHPPGDPVPLFEEAADAVEVVRRLWDSWDDDAVIRDVATGRFIDRDRVHYVDFAGEWFSVKGPSIVPRPPQGQPLVTVLAHADIAYRLAARSADAVFVTPRDAADARAIVAAVRAAEAAVGRTGAPLLVFADLMVFLDTNEYAAAHRRRRLDAAAGVVHRPDAAIFAGTGEDLAVLLTRWREAGLAGFRLRPGVLPHDLAFIVGEVVPALQARGAYPRRLVPGGLRERLGLGRPPARYMSVGEAS